MASSLLGPRFAPRPLLVGPFSPRRSPFCPLTDLYNSEDIGAIVINMGAHTVRAGDAGDDTPKLVFSSVHTSLRPSLLPFIANDPRCIIIEWIDFYDLV